MSYQSKREKITLFIKNQIIPVLQKSDLSYDEVIGVIRENTFCSDIQAQEEIKRQVYFKNIKEIHILTIPNEEISDWIKEVVEKEKEAKEEHQKAMEVLTTSQDGKITD